MRLPMRSKRFTRRSLSLITIVGPISPSFKKDWKGPALRSGCWTGTRRTRRCAALDVSKHCHARNDTSLELRASDVGESGFLPLGRGEIPVAGAGFVVVSAGAVGDGRSAPVIHSHLQQSSGRNPDAG